MPRSLSVLVLALLMAFVSGRAISYLPDDLDFAPTSGEQGQVPQGSPGPSGQAYVIPSINYQMVYIPPGTFMMGSPANEPSRSGDETQHQVTLTKGYYLGVTEVTQGQWKAVMGNNPSNFKNCGDDCPVESVSWNDAQEFIRRLNQREGANRYRLPTEAEWEYACRAGSSGSYAGDLDSLGWCWIWMRGFCRDRSPSGPAVALMLTFQW